MLKAYLPPLFIAYGVWVFKGVVKFDTCKDIVPLPLKKIIIKGSLHYTADTGDWQKRNWRTAEAQVVKENVSARLPDERPLVCYLSVTDRRGAMTSTEHAELP